MLGGSRFKDSMFAGTTYEIDGVGPPPWLIAYAEKLREERRGAHQSDDGSGIPEGWRDSTLCSLAGSMRARGMSHVAIEAALLAENAERCAPPLDDAQVRKIALSIARYTPDAYATVSVTLPTSPNGVNGTAPGQPFQFPDPVLCSMLRSADPNTAWVWKGYLSRGGLTLLTALWKAGKTTLIAHLLKALDAGGGFCGQPVSAARVLYVTEEPESKWAERRDELGLGDHLEFLVRPFKTRPDYPTWVAFCDYLSRLIRERSFGLLVIDPLSNLWPVKDENDAPQVQNALLPVQAAVGETCAGLLLHHNRKSDGIEATGFRGSGALGGFVDTIVELRRYAPKDRKDCRRVLTGYGRYDETPAEAVVSLTEQGYLVDGADRADVAAKDITNVLRALLPGLAPGWCYTEIVDQWPADQVPTKSSIIDALAQGANAGLWVCEGDGRKGDPRRYWRPL